MKTAFEKKFEGRAVYTRDGVLNSNIDPEFEQAFTKDIESKVEDWLKNINEESGPMIEFHTVSKNGKFVGNLYFCRSEICIKNSHNSWDIWRIATCAFWPRIISVYIKEAGLNDYRDAQIDKNNVMISEDIAPNEIRSENYGPPSKTFTQDIKDTLDKITKEMKPLLNNYLFEEKDKKCVCPRESLMISGCKCGGI